MGRRCVDVTITDAYGTVFGTGSSLAWLHCRAPMYFPYVYVKKVDYT
jgi:hypothetical protein